MGQKKDDAPPSFVLKLEGCANKDKQAVLDFSGVEDVKVDLSANELTVFGKVNPAMIRDGLAKKLQKKVEIVSCQPKKHAAADNKKPHDKLEKKAHKKKPNYKKNQDKNPKNESTKVNREVKRKEELVELLAPPTVVFKLHINCDGCANTIKRFVRCFSGVEDVKVDLSASELTVFGKVNPAMIRDGLAEKFHKEVEIVSRKPDDKLEKKAHKKKPNDKKDQNKKPKENESTKVNKEVKRKEEPVELSTQGTRRVNEILFEEIIQEAEHARNEAKQARNEAEHAQNERLKAKEDLQEKDELVQTLRLQCQETSEKAKRQFCAICLSNEKDLAFGCGHMTCQGCGKTLDKCPMCRKRITTRIKLFL